MAEGECVKPDAPVQIRSSSMTKGNRMKQKAKQGRTPKSLREAEKRAKLIGKASKRPSGDEQGNVPGQKRPEG
jgi:hypothetical protein